MDNHTFEIRIERLDEEDWRRWRELRLEALAEAPEAFSSSLVDWAGQGDREERWRSRFRAIPLNAIATFGGKPAGMVGATAPLNGASELVSLWVAPTARGKGVGDALVEEVADWARSRGVAILALNVRAANLHAVALYRRHGFLDAGPSPSGTDPHPEKRMSRSLL